MTIVAAVVLCLGPVAAGEKQTPSETEFCRLDMNSDREISYEEFMACEFYKLERVKKLPYADLQSFDRLRKGGLTDEDMKAYLFDKADRNKDRKIDRREWEEFYNSLMDQR